MEQTKFYLGEQIPYEDASIVDRVHHELCNSSWGGIYQTGRATGQSVYPIHKMLSYYPIIGPSLRGATMPSINTVDPRDIYCTTGIGNAPLISKRTLNNTLNENQLYRSDLGFRSNSIGSSDTETNNLFFRTNITADKINSSNTLLGLPSGLFAFGFSLNNPVFHFSSSTCALCQRFERRVNCNGCPLAIARDGTPCYKYSSKYDTKDQSDSRWGSDSVYWNSRNNPKPMIEQLKKAKKIMLKEIK
jgi:hypothetical protein